MAVRKTIQIGDPRLHQQAKTVKGGKISKKLVNDLVDTMRAEGLIGLAAPQIAHMERVFVTEIRKTEVRKQGLDKLRVYINPKITWFSKAEVNMYEGCGSILHGQLFGEVRRPKKITISYLDETGERHENTFDGLLARIIQHEYDHLDGILFTERMTDPTTLMTREHYLQMMKKKRVVRRGSQGSSR